MMGCIASIEVWRILKGAIFLILVIMMFSSVAFRVVVASVLAV